MQPKNKKQLQKKQTRRMHERLGAMVLLGGTLLSIVTISHDARRVLSQMAMRPVFSMIEHSGKENETARMPVRLDDALRAPTVGGN